MKRIKVINPDVKQASCTIVSNEKDAIIFDFGDVDSYREVEEEFKQFENIKVVISHFDKDHVENFSIFLDEKIKGNYDTVAIDKVYLPDRGNGKNSKKFNEIRKKIYMYEIISSTKDLFSLSDEEFNSFQKTIDKRSKYNNSVIFDKYNPKTELETLCLKFLVYRNHNKPVNSILSDIKEEMKKESLKNKDVDVYKQISLYAREICIKENKKFNEIEIQLIKPGEHIEEEIKGLGKLHIFKSSRKRYRNENQNSLVSVLETNNQKICIPGDCPATELKEIAKRFKESRLSKFLINMVAHHGSRFSICEEFSEIVRSKISIFQSNFHKHGHPHQETISHLKSKDTVLIQQEFVGKIETTIYEDGRSKIKLDRLTKLLHERDKKEFSLLEEIQNKREMLADKAEKIIKAKKKELLEKRNYSELEKIIDLDEPLDIMLHLKLPILNEYRKLCLQEGVINELINEGIDVNKISILNFLTVNGELKNFEEKKSIEETLEIYQNTKNINRKIDTLKDYVSKDLSIAETKNLFSKSVKNKDLNARDEIFEYLTEEQQNAFLDIKILEERLLNHDYNLVINENERNIKFNELGIELYEQFQER